MNREVKVIIPNMREFRVFYSDNEGSVMFSKRDWVKVKDEEHWKPSEEQMNYLSKAIKTLGEEGDCKTAAILSEIRTNLKK